MRWECKYQHSANVSLFDRECKEVKLAPQIAFCKLKKKTFQMIHVKDL